VVAKASNSASESSNDYTLGPVLLSVAIACAGAFAFGYHLGVVNGPLEAIAKDLGIAGDKALQGLVVSSTLAGAALGSVTGGGVSDALGRRKSFLLAAIPMLIGPLLSAYATSINVMIAGRFLAGAAIGLSSALVPTYISEVAPTKIRGTLGTVNQLMICIGILVALLVNVAMPVTAWRTMFLLAVAPALILGFGMLGAPESPRWLLTNKQVASAEATARKLWGPAGLVELGTAAGEEAVSAVKEAVSGTSEGLLQLLGTRSVQIGILLFVLQQFAGINALVYFSTSVFRQAGVQSDTLASAAVGATNVLGTIIAGAIIEKAGRKVLLANSYLGQAAAMFAMAAGFSLPALKELSAPIAVIGTLFYILSFALGAGPITGLVIPELNPAKIRGRAVAIAFVAHWVANVMLGQTFMAAVDAVGLSGVYAFFGSVALLAALYINTKLPETRGKSFEQIQKELGA